MRLSETKILAGFVTVACAIGLLEWMEPTRVDHQQIVVTPELREFVQQQVKGDATQALALTVEDEILYREGMHLGLDENDLIVKRRVVQKMRFLIEASTPLEEPNDAQLQAWLDDHPAEFLHEASVRFDHRFFARSSQEAIAADRAQVALSRLHSNPFTEQAKGDPHPFNSPALLIPRSALIRELGTQAADALIALPAGQWSGPIQSSVGVHLFKVLEQRPAVQKTIEEAGLPLIAAVENAQRDRMNQAAIEAIKSKYTIVQSEPTATALMDVKR